MPILTESDDKRKPKGRRFRWLALLVLPLVPALLALLVVMFAWFHPIQLKVAGHQFECEWQTYAGAGDPIAVWHPHHSGFETIFGSGHSYCFTSLGPAPLLTYDVF